MVFIKENIDATVSQAKTEEATAQDGATVKT